MSPRSPRHHDSLLDNGIFESDMKPSAPQRLWKSFVELVRPAIMTRTSGPRKQVRKTAYLDGLRGFAAFMVYWGHHQLWCRDSIKADRFFENGFGYDKNFYFAQLPGVRTFFSGGHFAVTVFFVISGYVLSMKPLQLIQAGDHVKLGDNVSSALFRRWLRLHLPVIATTFLYMTSWHLFGIWTDSTQEANYRDELWKWYAELKNFTFVFRTGGDPWFSYSFHVWSIPVEFRGSIVIYTVALAYSRITKNARLWGEALLIFYFMYIVDGWFCSMFMAGMLICDLDQLADKGELPSIFNRLEPYKNFIYYNLFFISLYLGGVPSHTNDLNILRATPGWYYLSFLKPQAVFDYKWFYLFFASSFLVSSIPRIGWLKTFFEMRFNQYLGRISYAFYLVHGPILWTLGDRLYVAVGWYRTTHQLGLPTWINIFPLSKSGPLGLEPSFIIPHIILLPFTLWMAEIGTKLIDDPSVTFAAWLYKKTLPQNGQKA